MANINRVILTGNLTADPELHTLPSGTSVCNARIAVNRRYKDSSTGEWQEKANFFNVKVWGASGEALAKHLSKGSPVAIDGRLEYREWETDEGGKRNTVEVVADTVQFLGSGNGNGNGQQAQATPSEQPAAQGSLTNGASDDDIPF